ncbi:MAG: thiamine phosphate synthase [Rhizobiales bacterium]|nr:thiamine phosphate synthase [Hyphomicrobiales bacterium]
MDTVAGEGGLIPRLFLVAPEGSANHLAACLKAACAAGDVASLLLPPSLARELTPLAQELGVAVLALGVAQNADGVHVEATAEAVTAARQSVGERGIVGAYAGTSRHFAMEAAEAGADYVAFSQNGPAMGGEPIVKWWADFFEIPCVAFDPVEVAGLDTLLPQTPDFIRPPDAMWDGPEAAHRIVTGLMQRLKQT